MKSEETVDVTIEPVEFKPSDHGVIQNWWKPFNAVLVLLALVIGVAMWFLFTAKSVRFISPEAPTKLELSGGLHLSLGEVHLLRTGSYHLDTEVPGYEPFSDTVEVGAPRNQDIKLQLIPLPGRITITSNPAGATVAWAEQILGQTPIEDYLLGSGEYSLKFSFPRYQEQIRTLVVAGKSQHQQIDATLEPNWADIKLETNPPGAEVSVDGVVVNQQTPAVVSILAGEHDIQLKVSGYKRYRRRILVTAGEPMEFTNINLEQADVLITIETRPSGAGITLNGSYQGKSPIELAVTSGRNYQVQTFKAGYATVKEKILLQPGEDRTLTLPLRQLTGQIFIETQPADAVLLVNGIEKGRASRQLTLPTNRHTIEIKAPGYAGYKTTITPKEGIPQQLKVKLLTESEARLAALRPIINTEAGHELRLIQGGEVQLGASRREPGRRANETLVKVNLDRLFYLGTNEVTNKQFQVFSPGHDSGEFQEENLSKDDFPVAGVSWIDAAGYCNWLSAREGFTPFYNIRAGTLEGVNPSSTGYRLPTEAEWSIAARNLDENNEPTQFPWGNTLPPPDRQGNYADRSAAHLVGRTIFGYNDNYIAAAPVGTFPANQLGIFDLGGNVAEWNHDYYAIPAPNGPTLIDTLGPPTGEYHVIKGASWMQGQLTDLRLSYRDYGTDGRKDVGFRLARYAEAK